jgi:hypothetical protein
LSEILSEKIGEWTTFNQWYQPQYQQQKQQMPFDWMLVASVDMPQHGPATMWELIDIEKKLVEMKALTVAGIHYMHLSERLAELEQLVHLIEGVQKRERCIEKIKTLKAQLEEHIEFSPAFVTVSEKFYQHQQKYEKMCQLVGDLECHFIESQTTMTTGVMTVQQQPETTTFGRYHGSQYGLNLVHQKFVRLVQEFQIQFPDCFAPKVDEIVAYLRQVNTGVYPRRGGVVFGQELKEKLAEFETILSQPECEIACLTTSIFPQSSTSTMKAQRECLKYLIRQVRDLKHQVQFHLKQQQQQQQQQPQQPTGQWTVETLINQHEQRMQPEQRQQYVEECQLVNLLNKNMWINGGCPQQQQQQQWTGENNKFFGGVRVPHKPTGQSVVEATSTTTTATSINKPTIVKSITMPVNGGLIKPISIEKFIQEQEWFEQQEEQKTGGSFFYPQQQQQGGKVRFSTTSFELECEEASEDEEDFDFGADAEITISTLLSQPTMIRIEGGNYSPVVKTTEGVDECLCQIEKHIRKALNNNGSFVQQHFSQQPTECPLCTVETKTTKTTTATIGGVRKF